MVSVLLRGGQQVKADAGVNGAVRMETGPPPGYRGSGMTSFEEKSKCAGKRGLGQLKQERPPEKEHDGLEASRRMVSRGNGQTNCWVTVDPVQGGILCLPCSESG